MPGRLNTRKAAQPAWHISYGISGMAYDLWPTGTEREQRPTRDGQHPLARRVVVHAEDRRALRCLLPVDVACHN